MGLAVLGLLALFISAGVSRRAANASIPSVGLALIAGQESQQATAAIHDSTFISSTVAPIRPCLTGATKLPPETLSAAFDRRHAGPEDERQSELVTALILEKYLHFRESLSSP